MNTNTSKSSFGRLDPAVSVKAIEQSLPSFDSNRATGYSELGSLRSAKSSSLVREQKFLLAKHGGTASPRARTAASLLAYNERLRREIAATQEIVETPSPEVDANSFVVHGFVRRSNQAGVPGLTLALTDEKGTWLREFGYACTDKRGYFLLRIGRNSAEKPVKESEPAKTEAELKREAAKVKREEEAAAAAAVAAGAPASQSGGSAAGASASLSSGQKINTNLDSYAAASRRSLQLRVFNRDGRVLHTETRPVVLTPDTIDYRLIILDEEDCGCTPPPATSNGPANPNSPSAPPAPPPAPAQPVATTPVGRVSQLKSYDQPRNEASQPLEAIRGIGPKGAAKLRAAGIKDVSEFEKSRGEKLVKLAGFDKTAPKPTKPSASDAPKQAARKTAKKSSSSSKAKRPKK